MCVCGDICLNPHDRMTTPRGTSANLVMAATCRGVLCVICTGYKTIIRC